MRLNSCLCPIRHGEIIEVCLYNLGAFIFFPFFCFVEFPYGDMLPLCGLFPAGLEDGNFDVWALIEERTLNGAQSFVSLLALFPVEP